MTTFRALTTAVSVDIDDGVPLADVARALIQSYPQTADAELRYELRPRELLRDGQSLLVADPQDIVPLFEMDLYEQIGARATPGWLLHAAALEVNGRALVLCGASGAGKTTLTLTLSARGYRLLSEEVVWIDKAGVVCGLPRPIHVQADGRGRVAIPDTWKQLRYPIQGRDGVLREHLLVVPPIEALVLGALPLGAVVRIGHGAGWPAYLRESPHRIALQRLWDRSLRQDDAGLEAATSVLREHGSFELSSATADQALSLLEPLLK